MKFQMNGALTIGTLDGANIEIREEVGAENFFLFGMNAERGAGAARAAAIARWSCTTAKPELREVHRSDPRRLLLARQWRAVPRLIDNLLHHDPYMVLADYQAYAECQQRVDAAFRDVERWTRMSILNTARSGKFSSDRTIREYCADIWRVNSVPVELLQPEDIKAELAH